MCSIFVYVFMFYCFSIYCVAVCRYLKKLAKSSLAVPVIQAITSNKGCILLQAVNKTELAVL